MDYRVKSQLIELGLHKEVNRLKGQYYKEVSKRVVNINMVTDNYIQAIKNIRDKFKYIHCDVIHECFKILNSGYNRRHRIKRRILSMFTLGECKFITLTFTDKVLNLTTFESRRKYVQRWCSSQSFYYIANIDFGEKNEREHYHVIMQRDDDIDFRSWEYGAINFKRIVPMRYSAEKLCKYVDKLTNHAIKETVKQNRVIFSRKCKDLDEIYKVLEKNNKIV